MKVLLPRLKFGVTITYHFLFVPLTIGLALLVAVMQVLAYTHKEEVWERLSRFFGTLFLINFAAGGSHRIVRSSCSRSSSSRRSSGCGCSAATGCPRWCTRSRSAW